MMAKTAKKAGKKVSGRIVSTTSGAGLFGNVGQVNYGSAKSGIATMMLLTAPVTSNRSPPPRSPLAPSTIS